MQKIMQLLASNRALASFEARTNRQQTDIYLYSPIAEDAETADAFGGVDPVAFVQAVTEAAPTLNLYVNSPGGSVFGARAMGAALDRYQGKINAFVDGMAASAASVLLTYADNVTMSKGSFVMIHKAWALAMGNADDMRQQADLLEQVDQTIIDSYATQTGMSAEDIAAMMAAETWLDSQKALELGFADRVEGSTEQQNSWDLSAFDRPPETLAAADQGDMDKLRARLRLARAKATA
jgi:ATP-dependent Clp protease protease subunit